VSADVRQKDEEMKDSPKKIWFEAKEYGYGVGLPASWEGWVAFIGYFVLLIAGFFIFPIQKNLGHHILFLSGITVALVAIGIAKSPKWRWRRGYDDLEQLSKRQAAAKRKQEVKRPSNQKMDPIN
jgi:hypothetical protein